MRSIQDVAADVGLKPADLELYGNHIAKVRSDSGTREGKLVLVSAVTPNKRGVGKTTLSVGLNDALWRIGEASIVALREPSLGPVFGIKGGATGGGGARLQPAEDIDLHFTGDLHAVTAAHNLLAAMVDNHRYFGTGPDLTRVLWRRALDMGDRTIRDIVVGLNGNGATRQCGFDITASSEVMAVLCLAEDEADLRARLGRMVVARTRDHAPVTAEEIGAAGAMVRLLRKAMLPNLVQSNEGRPGIVHGGPFANVAHGTNSIVGTRLALRLADYTITEAGFGFDLGGEKFFHIVCRQAGLRPSLVVLAATIDTLEAPGDLERHVAAANAFGVPVVVAINRHSDDRDEDIEAALGRCEGLGVPAVEVDVFGRGGEGGEALARAVVEHARDPIEPNWLYPTDAPFVEKVAAVARRVYGVDEVRFSPAAARAAARFAKDGYGDLPVCIARSQYGPSSPTEVRELSLRAGAGFVVPICGEMMLMPGMPREPAALTM